MNNFLNSKICQKYCRSSFTQVSNLKDSIISLTLIQKGIEVEEFSVVECNSFEVWNPTNWSNKSFASSSNRVGGGVSPFSRGLLDKSAWKSSFEPKLVPLAPPANKDFFYKSGALSWPLKPNYFKKQCSSSSFLLTWSKYTGPKWPWSTQKASPIY